MSLSPFLTTPPMNFNTTNTAHNDVFGDNNQLFDAIVNQKQNDAAAAAASNMLDSFSYIPYDLFLTGDISPNFANLINELTVPPQVSTAGNASATSAPIAIQEEHRPVPIMTLPSRLNISDLIDGVVGSEQQQQQHESSSQQSNCGHVEKEQDACEDDNGWKIVKLDSSIVTPGCGTKIVLSSRKFSSSERIDSELYSCVTYEMRHEAFGSFVEDATERHRVLLVRVEVVDPSTGQVVRKNNKTILDGSAEGAITKLNHSDVWRHDMKIKFNSCSYHFNKIGFKFRVSYFFENLEEPFLVKESSEFMIYARVKKQEKKSSATTAQTQKRKRSAAFDSAETYEESTNQNNNKKTRTMVALSPELETFSNKLNALLNDMSKLASEERQLAYDMLENRFREQIC